MLRSIARTAWRGLRRRWRLLARAALAAAALVILAGIAFGIAWRASPFPMERLWRLAASPCVTDAEGNPLLLRVNDAGDWRLPVPLAEISPWLRAATIAAEDGRFYAHGGVDFTAACRAAVQNAASGRVVSGASTITMQVCRMLEPSPRSLCAKAYQAFRAWQLEARLSKDEILAAYLNLAPYGGNIRGAEAAARLYFGKPAADLSLGEAALLAGLPQSPARYRPDRHAEAARDRRAVVLARMRARGMIDAVQEAAAQREPVPTARRTLPPAPHAAWMALQRRPGGARTTLRSALQAEVEALVREFAAARGIARHSHADPTKSPQPTRAAGGRFATAPSLPADADVAVVVIDIAAAQIVALVGSVDVADPRRGQVNGATARRSPGSALKPFIFAAACETGALGPDSTVYDLPIERAGWTPANFDRSYSGAVSAADALRRSLNVPAILIAEGVGAACCLGTLESAGIHLPRGTARRSGLTIATGGLETTLVELTNAYATLGRGGTRRPARLIADEPDEPLAALSPATCAALDAMLSCRARMAAGLPAITRTPMGVHTDAPWFMWKTGTSSSRRDAWAVGHNRRYAIGVWVGRFDGGGAAGLVGSQAAEPLLTALFSSPMLRNDVDPPPPPAIVVTRPLPPPREWGERLRITMPAAGAALLATNGVTSFAPRAVLGGAGRTRGACSLRWFLNGRLLDAEDAARVTLAPGRYELRCVSDAGDTDAVEFTVRPASARGR